METNQRRVEQFHREVADLKIPTPADETELAWLTAGLGCIGASVVVIVL